MATGMDSASKTGYDTAELKSCPITLYPLADEWSEIEWLHAVARNPAFQYLKDAAEDIYTATDGEPFRDLMTTMTTLGHRELGSLSPRMQSQVRERLSVLFGL